MSSAVPSADVLTATIERLSVADSVEDVTGIVAAAVRTLTGADGATFVLREDGKCFYVDENAIGPLWKGNRFDLTACISGWSMLNKQTVIVPDIYVDDRIPHDAYRPTFVKSLAMAPIRAVDPIGAIGAYWSVEHQAGAEEMRALEVLANSAAVALENLELRSAIVRRRAERDSFAARTDELELAIHSMVHDLRSPLTAMIGYADLIESGSATSAEETESFARTISESGLRMAEQIERMLALYRITSMPVQPAPVDLSDLGRQIATDLTIRHRDRDVSIVVDDGLLAEADPVLARLLLDNLLENAVKYTAKVPAARVVLSAVPELSTDRLNAFAVRDNGAGFDASRSAELFRPMTRLHSAEQFPGTGLGLASVARIAELHGGDVRADSPSDGGAVFTFRLPRAA